MGETPDRIRARSASHYMALSLWLFLFALYLFSYRGGFHSVDEVSIFAVTESMVKFGRLNTDQIAWTQWVTTQAEAQGFFGQDGHVYSKKGLALSLAQAPLYGLALLLPGLGMLQTVSLLNAILTAWTGSLLFVLLRRFNYSVGVALVTALLYGLATLAWVYAKYLFSEPLAGWLLLLTFYFLLVFKQEGKLWPLALAGFCAGLTVLARANNLLLLVIFGCYLLAVLATPTPELQARLNVGPQPQLFYLRQIWRKALLALGVFAAGAAVAGLIFAWYNWVRAGNPLQTGYDLSIFTPNILLGLYKLLFSPLRGLFIYSPLLLLALPGWFWLRRVYPTEAWLIFGLVGVTILLFSAWSSGEGLSWGSRFLVPIVPLLMIAIAPSIERFARLPFLARWAIVALVLISTTIQILGVVINPWVHLGQLQAEYGGEFFLERTAALTDFSTSQIVGQLCYWQVQNSDLIWWQPSMFDGVAFGLGAVLLVGTGWLLTQTSAARQTAATPRLVILALLAMLGVTGFLLVRYYQTDPQFGGLDQPYIQALTQVADEALAGDQVITVAQYHYHLPMNRFKARVPILGFAQIAGPLPATAEQLLASILANESGRAWLVTVGRQPTEAENGVEAWLAHHAFKADDLWLDQTRLVDYGLPELSETILVDQTLAETIKLTTLTRPDTAQSGQILPVELHWQAMQPPPADYTVFLQLIAINGSLAAQHDGLPQGGYLPTSRWPIDNPIIDRHGLALPATLSGGDYRLIVGLYDPRDGTRLQTSTGADFIDLGIVTVTP